MTDNYKHADLTGLIIQAFYKVYNRLGYGFLEKVYENAMLIELKKLGLDCLFQHPIEVFYEDQKVGLYIADIEVGLLLNFGKKPECKRKVFSSDFKTLSKS